MTLQDDLRARRGRGDAPVVRRTGPAFGVLVAAAATFALRIPFVHAPLSSDEGGFLVVARGWHAGGGSLYGGHWVDRPPLLLEVFKAAAQLGGLTPLRVIGALAAAATVLLVGLAVRRAAGDRAATWAALVAGALLASPVLGAVPVNGELLAAPFVAGGVWGAVTAVSSPVGPPLRRAAWVTGAAAVAAVLVKQNMVDVLVFAGVLTVVTGRRRFDAAWLRCAAGHLVAGAVGAAAFVLGLAALLGTGPGSVFFAMYPFRVRAASVMAYVPWGVRWSRIGHLAEAFALSLGPLVLVALLVVLVQRRLSRDRLTVAVASLALAGWSVVSVLAGGSYWLHYQVELVVPVALAAGLVVGSGARWARPVVAAALVAGLGGWVLGLHDTVDASGQVIGTAVGAAAAPGDSVVSLLGDGSLVEASGLSSAYPYLWSLPSRTLDPRLTDLADQLEGPTPPDWVVVRGPATRTYLAARPVGALLRDGYRPVARICSRTVYLRDGLDRPVPVSPASGDGCRLPLVDRSDLLTGDP